MKYIILFLLFSLVAEAPSVEPFKPTPIQRQLYALKNEVGVKEDRNNRGKEIRKYQEFTGTIGKPWCTSFLTYIYNREASELGLGLLPKEASSQALYRWARKKHYLTTTPQPGDIVIWRKGRTQYGHAGAIIKIEGDSLFTIEGNTTGEGKEGVYEKVHYKTTRTKLKIRGYIAIRKVWYV